MSTLAYAALTNKREEAAPGTSTNEQGPGMSTYIDAFAGLVPAEVLTVHALIIAKTFTTDPGNSNVTTLPPDNVEILQWSFYGLLAVSVILYATGRLQKTDAKSKWDNWDFFRMLIPPFAFTGWTMIQKSTAFDAVVYHHPVSDVVRTVVALFLAVLLGVAASVLAYKADGKKTDESQMSIQKSPDSSSEL